MAGPETGESVAADSLLDAKPGNPDADGPPTGNKPIAASLLVETKFGPTDSEWFIDANTDGDTALMKFGFCETAVMNGFKIVCGIANNNC